MKTDDELDEYEREESEFKAEKEAGYYQPPAETESADETARKSGMAYSAAISLVVAVVMGLGLGGLADYLLRSSPLGIIIGIALGSMLGFYIFFTTTSRIFKK
jgi:F0F1-type ATP synthase assembly protein I